MSTIKHLYGNVSGAITEIRVDGIRMYQVAGEYSAKVTESSVIIGKLSSWDGRELMIPVAAWRTVRDRDTVIQINSDGQIHLLNAVNGTRYTFNFIV